MGLYSMSEECGQNRTKKRSEALRLICIYEIYEGRLVYFPIFRVLSNILVPFPICSFIQHLLNYSYMTVTGLSTGNSNKRQPPVARN